MSLGIGVSVGGVSVWLALRGVDPALLFDGIGRVNVGLVLLAFSSVAATVCVAASRWCLLVYPHRSPRPWMAFVSATIVGQFVNIVLPVRLGEVARALVIRGLESEPLGRVLATIAAERLADALMLGASVSVLLASASLPAWARASGPFLVLSGVLALIAIVAVARWGHALVRVVERAVSILPRRLRDRLVAQMTLALTGFAAYRSRRANAAVGVLSVLLVVLAASTNYLLFRAFDLALPPATALLLLVVLQTGTGAVSTPGSLGLFHYLTMIVLAASGVDRTVALSYAIVLHGVAIVPKIVAGAIIVVLGGESGVAAVRRQVAVFASRGGMGGG